MDNDPFPPGFFERTDWASDAEFYSWPRLVTHIDEQAIAAVGHWVHVYIDKVTRRPTPIPDDIRALLSTARVS